MHHAHGRIRRGFTLFEMMIAITLGIILLLTCFAGLRLTAQTLIASKQLSNENALLRIGVEQALDESDFWTLADNPVDPSNQGLRGVEPEPWILPQGSGFKAFTPFTQTPDYATNVNGMTGFEDAASGFDETRTTIHGGWNPSPLAWAAWNPRTWPNICMAEEDNRPSCFGTCEIYGNLDRTLAWHYWYDDQVRGLLDAVGFYGMYEYLPSNAYIMYHGNSTPLGSPQFNPMMSWGSEPVCLVAEGGWLCPYDCQDYIKGRVRNTNGVRVFLPNATTTAASPGISRSLAKTGYVGRDDNYGTGDVYNFLSNTSFNRDLLPVRPFNWDDVSFETHRYIERGHPLILNMVSCRSSLTGKGFAIAFTCIGTTLRGARQQRTPTPAGGWVANPYTDACMDYQTPP